MPLTRPLIVAETRAWIGTPYRHQASLKGVGCDCLGLVRGVWRAVIGEGFTLHNVRRLCQALANDITRRGLEARGVLIGYDRRFASEDFAAACAEVLAGNGLRVWLTETAAPRKFAT
jgi:hypothetical protein